MKNIIVSIYGSLYTLFKKLLHDYISQGLGKKAEFTPEVSTEDSLISDPLQRGGQAKRTNEMLGHPGSSNSRKLLPPLDLKGKGRNSAT